MNLFKSLFTKDFSEIPLLFISFNHKKYKKKGKVDSCDIKLHKSVEKDEKLTQMINDVVDYIRDNNDMSKI